MTATASKPNNPLLSHNLNYLEQIGESSFSSLPKYYESDTMNQASTPTFRSVSPKLYHGQQKKDYFEDTEKELEMGDECDTLYETTLLNAHFMLEEPAVKKIDSPLARLRQLLEHMQPNYSIRSSSPLSTTLSKPPSIRSQFSQQQSSGQTHQPMVSNNMAVAITEPRLSKGKGKLKPTL